ncbi:MAG TPA: hypothetical protein VJ821_04415 [Anaerolineales bacterium]|nr:hypothetical protein [Anaerolineales bacterium]
MKARRYVPGAVTVFAAALLLMSCLLPGMIPLTPIPTVPAPQMEENTETLIETLNGQDWVYLESLAEEQYTEEDFAKPGTITYTVKITDDQPTYFNYGWCATTDEILAQNFEHIRVQLYFNEEELGSDVVHVITFTRPDGLRCGSFGTLLSDWPNGEYKLEAVATFDEPINDGLADYEAGDYMFVYNVTVEK